MSEMKFTIDGKECAAKAGQTIVEAARDNGVYIPTLCHLDGLSEAVKPFGAPGLLWFKRAAEGVASPAKKALGDEGVLRFLDAAGAGTGDLLLALGGPAATVFAALGALRLQLARERGLIAAGRHDFLWVTDFPLLEWNAEMEEPEPGHRHISHLFGLYPGEQFDPERTPAQSRMTRRERIGRLSQRPARGTRHPGGRRVATAALF